MIQNPNFKLIWEVSDAPIFEMGHGTIFSDQKQRELFGYSTKGQILFGKNENLSSYHTNKDFEEASKHGFWFYSNNENYKKFLHGVKRLHDKVVLLENKTNKLFLDKDTRRKDLGRLLIEVSETQILCFCHFNLTNPNFTNGLESKLRDYLVRKSIEPVDQILGILTTPEKLSSLQIETLEFYKILKRNRGSLKTSTPKLEADIRNHSLKYQYLGGNEGNDKWDLEYYLELIRQIVKKESFDIDTEIKIIESYPQKIKSEKEETLKKFDINLESQDIAKKLGEIGHTRLELRIVWSSLFRIMRRIIYKVANLLEVPAYDLLVCEPKELYSWFVLGRRLSPQEILNRRKAYIYILDGREIKLAYGDKAIKLKQSVIPDKDFSNTKLLEGKPAYPGTVRGKAFVFNWDNPDFNRQISDMPSGAILVAGQTRPSLMPAIRKASAIVTDEGGITSHAAIVSRELKIPCVIGTEYATKVFKTGDSVEVDAQKGIIVLINLSQ